MQQDHFTVTDQAQDISAVYPAGTYLAQATVYAEGSEGILYATAVTAPVVDADFFRANTANPLFQFTAGSGIPTWVKSSLAGLTLTLAVAQIG